MAIKKKTTRKATARKGTAQPRRVSQITKRPPTKRLVSRRLANTAPGYFPNPTHKYADSREFPEFSITQSDSNEQPFEGEWEYVCHVDGRETAKTLVKILQKHARKGFYYHAWYSGDPGKHGLLDIDY